MRRGLAGLVVSTMLLTGCATFPTGAPSTPSTSTAEHLAARRSLGIPDCPAGDRLVPPRTDGLPNYLLECLGGTSLVPLAGLRGRPLLVVVWAQWCPPCREELPVLGRELPAYDGKVDVLLVDYGELRYPLALDLLRDTGMTRYPVVVDPDKTLLPGLRAEGIPRSYVVDADGRIVDRHTGGYKSADDLRASLAKAGVR